MGKEPRGIWLIRGECWDNLKLYTGNWRLMNLAFARRKMTLCQHFSISLYDKVISKSFGVTSCPSSHLLKQCGKFRSHVATCFYWVHTPIAAAAAADYPQA